MALVFCDSFDSGLSKWTTSSGGSSQTGRLGAGLCREFSASGTASIRGLPSGATTIIYGAAVYPLSVGGGGYRAHAFIIGDGPYLFWEYTTPSRLVFILPGPVYYYTSAALPMNQWTYVEAKVVYGTSGLLQVRFNNSLVLNQSANTTSSLNAGGGTQNHTSWTGVAQFGSTDQQVTYRVDDFYICDTTGSVANNFLGDSVVTTLRPNAAGAYTDFSRGGTDSGTNWGQVDDPGDPNDATDYVQSSTLGTMDTYGVPDIASNYFSIHGVQAVGRLTKADAGNRAVALAVRSGGNDYFSSDFYLGAGSWSTRFKSWSANPDTGIAWTIDEINAAEFGVKVTV